MTTYYVRKTGNDTTGNGSDATPWLTVSKAVEMISTAGGHTVNIGAGTYAESTSGLHYFMTNTAYTALTTFQADGTGEVVITDDGAVTTYSTRIRQSANIKFVGIHFRGATFKSLGAISFEDYACSNIQFVNCTITHTTRAGAAYGIFCNIATVTCEDIVFDGCTVIQNGTDLASKNARFTLTGAGSLDGVTLRNCTISNISTALIIEGVTNLLVDDGTYHSTSGYGIICGMDGATGKTVTGEIKNAAVSSGTGHGLLIGAGCNGVAVNNVAGNGGNQGIVLKECSNVIVTGGEFTSVSGHGAYFKAAVDCTITQARVSMAAGIVVGVERNEDNGHLCQNVTFTYNTVIGSGTAQIFNWIAADDLGGGVCDYNIYTNAGSGLFGDVLADGDVKNLTELRAAWVGYGDGSNDSHSRMAGGQSMLNLGGGRGFGLNGIGGRGLRVIG